MGPTARHLAVGYSGQRPAPVLAAGFTAGENREPADGAAWPRLDWELCQLSQAGRGWNGRPPGTGAMPAESSPLTAAQQAGRRPSL